YALDHNVERLAEDHTNAKRLARGLAQIPGITVEESETNLVFFDVSGTGMTTDEIYARARPHGLIFSQNSAKRGRACLHLDVTEAQVDEAIGIFRAAVGSN